MKICTCSPLAFLARLGLWLIRLFIAFAIAYIATLASIATYQIIINH